MISRRLALALFPAAGLGACTGLLPGQGDPAQLYTLTPKSSFAPDLPAVSWQLVVEQPVAAAGLTIADIDWLMPHQANVRILQATGRKLGLPPEKVVVTVDRHANTSAASVPLALDVAVRDGRIRPGHLVMLQGVGGGFTWGAVLVRF